MTGFGGGALMTTLLVLVFKLEPLTAVGTDLVAALGMKPIGAAVHLRRGTVHREIVLWLAVGSVPAALAGVLLLRVLDPGQAEGFLRQALGLALLASAASMLLRPRIARLRGERSRVEQGDRERIPVRRLTTIALGVVGGFVVGLTSVGSGSVLMVLLLLVYPALRPAQLVGTDLALSVPLLGAAAAGHLLFGDVRLAVAGALLVGALPGVYVGALLSSRAPDAVVRPALIVVLFSTGLKLVNII